MRASFPTAEGHSSVLSRKSANLILKPILISGFILNVLMLVQLSNYRLTGLVLSSSVFGPLVNVRFSCKLYLLWLHNWHLDHEQSWLTLLRGSTFTGFWLIKKKVKPSPFTKCRAAVLAMAGCAGLSKAEIWRNLGVTWIFANYLLMQLRATCSFWTCWAPGPAELLLTSSVVYELYCILVYWIDLKHSIVES